ncbi:unannotated protein [freshwater metagenome]|uniref:Unannotated protein n=1 Tax=freshwater metagenome TaxID=449393 RepID=A0A6J6L719_9ZZZZ
MNNAMQTPMTRVQEPTASLTPDQGPLLPDSQKLQRLTSDFVSDLGLEQKYPTAMLDIVEHR